MTKSAR